MTKEKTITPGTIVRLKSGGPWMTVGERLVELQLDCHWFVGAANFSGKFHPLSLLTQSEDESFPGTRQEYAQRAYKAYGEEADWKNFQGKPMPAWGELPENIRKYWEAATTQIISDCNTKYNASRQR